MSKYRVGVTKRYYSIFEQESMKFGPTEFIGALPVKSVFYVFYELEVADLDMDYLKLKYDLIGCEELDRKTGKSAPQ